MVIIENTANVSLQAHERALLQALFADYARLVIKAEFRGGLSGSRLLRVHPIRTGNLPELPAVVKIDFRERIQQEVAAFENCIHNRVPKMADLAGTPVWAGLYGALRYTVAGGGAFEIESLHEHLQRADETQAQAVLTGQLFPNLAVLWQNNQSYPDFPFGIYYDVFLPPHLVVHLDADAATPPWRLNPEAVRQGGAVVGEWVTLTGFHVQRVLPDSLLLDLPQPGGCRCLVRGVADTAGYHPLVGQPLPAPLTGLVGHTRATQLQARAEAILGPGPDLAAPTLSITPDLALPNPLSALPALLAYTQTVRQSCLHADLNLENVLVETGNQNIHVIDFVNARQDHVLHDLLRLELEVVTKLLPPALGDDAEPASVIRTLYQRLHCALTQNVPVSAPPGLEKPFALLRCIRQAALTYQLLSPQGWTEYYTGLVFYLLWSLGFSNLNDLPTAPRPRQLAFWGAAAALELRQTAPDCAAISKQSQFDTLRGQVPEGRAVPPLLGRGRRWAVMAGVNHYVDPSISDLTVCVQDVAAIHQRLTSGYYHTQLLTDENTPSLLPTRNNILAELTNAAQLAQEDDLLLFYFSGHGLAAGGESYLVPRDARLSALPDTAVSMKKVRRIMKKSAARARVIILDACHSGASIGKSPVVMTPEFIERVFVAAEGMAVLASCKQNQLSWEWQQQQQSVFTHYLLQALHGEADRDNKGFVTVSDAHRFVTDRVIEWSTQNGQAQTPTLESKVVGDIILADVSGIQDAIDSVDKSEKPFPPGNSNNIPTGSREQEKMNSKLTELHEKLLAHSNLSDLRDICFFMDIDTDNYPYGKDDFIREFLRNIYQRRRIDELIAVLKERKPWVLR